MTALETIVSMQRLIVDPDCAVGTGMQEPVSPPGIDPAVA
jgi:hypothetical protein